MTRDLFHLDEDEPPQTFNGGVSVKTIELDMVLHYDNPVRDAILASETGEESSAVWLARSQIQMNQSGKKVPAIKKDGQHTILPVIAVSMPEWLAKDKGLI